MSETSKVYRILFTGIGRRVELIQAFRNAAQNLRCNLKIYGADISDTAPALHYCDYKRMVYPMKDANYISHLLNICSQDSIDLIIPTIDTDLLLLAVNKEKFGAIGTKILISGEDKIAVCTDKNLTADFFHSCGLKSPSPVNDYRKYTGEYPCFIKPKDGSSSINAFRIDTEEDLPLYAGKVFDYIIQPFIEGIEYTVDIMCDFDGNPIFIVPRERVVVRSGEVLKTKIEMDEKIIYECKKIIKKFQPCGPITVQLIRQRETGDDYYIEINPRFGGGAPLSMKAGADSAEAVLELLMDGVTKEKSGKIKDGAVYSRYDQSVCALCPSSYKKKVKGIIFDLDDTLYSEKDYVRSGFHRVAQEFPDVTGAEEKLWNAFLEGKQAIDTYLSSEGIFDEDIRSHCLEIYRNHFPTIRLYPEIRELLSELKAEGIKIGIITDGRPEGQRKKIQALGLEGMIDDILITDELGGIQFRKPNDISFRILQKRWNIPFDQIAYAGDNPQKDFAAPHQLGMQTIFFRNTDGLYREEHEVQTTYVIDKIQEIKNIVKIRGGGGKT